LKKSKTSHLDCSSQIQGNIVQNHEQKKKVKKVKNQDSMDRKNYFFKAPCSLALGQFQLHGFMKELLRKYRKNKLETRFELNFTTGSYRIGIRHAWCSQKACEICSALV
jgi:hypothetical protein